MKTDTKIKNIQAPNKWQIKKVNNLHVLHYFDMPVQCTYRMPVMLPHPSISGQAVINQAVCCETCPFFNLKQDGLFSKLRFECANGYEIDVYHYMPMES